MNQCFKYLSAINLVTLAHHIVGNNLVTTGDANSDVGFEQLFKWRSLRNGFKEAKNIDKPIFLLIHKPQCPACQKLKQKFPKSVRLMDLSDRFVMIKAEMDTDSILDDKKFRPDGKYVPRILFFTSNGDFIKEAYNKHADADTEHKYFYKNPSQVVDTMLYVLKNYSKEPLPIKFQHNQASTPDCCDLDDDLISPTLFS